MENLTLGVGAAVAVIVLALVGYGVVVSDPAGGQAGPELAIDDATVTEGETATLTITLSEAPRGLLEYRLIAEVNETDTATIVDGSVPDHFTPDSFQSVTVGSRGGAAVLRATDVPSSGDGVVVPGDSDVVLGTVVVRGVEPGEVALTLTVDRMQDDRDPPKAVDPLVRNATVTVVASEPSGVGADAPDDETGDAGVDGAGAGDGDDAGTDAPDDADGATDTPSNALPVARAGADQRVEAGTTVVLDGGESNDSDDDRLTYRWEQVSGPDVDLSGATTATPSFTAPTVDTATRLTFELTATDAAGASDTDAVEVVVEPTATPTPTPTETADSDDSGGSDGSDGSTAGDGGSADGDSGGDGSDSSNGSGDDGADRDATPTPQPSNAAPTADAGSDRSVDSGQRVVLDAGGSRDADGDDLTYRWEQVSGPTVTLSDDADDTASFTAPTVEGPWTLSFTVTVTDAEGASDSDTVVVTVEPASSSTPPTADAGSDRVVDAGRNVSLDGSGSSDPDGDDLTYRWEQVSGPDVTLSDVGTATPSFTAPTVEDRRTLRFELTVSDGGGATDTDVVVVAVVPVAADAPPTADAGSGTTVEAGQNVSLDGSGSADPDGEDENLTYRWEQVSGPAVDLRAVTTVTPVFTAPEVSQRETLTFELTVTDESGASDTDSVSLTVVPLPANAPPTADAGRDQSVDAGAEVTLDGSGSSDPENGTLTYRWEQTSGPSVDLSDPAAVSPGFAAPESDGRETLRFELTVSDDAGATDTDTVAVSIDPAEPSTPTPTPPATPTPTPPATPTPTPPATPEENVPPSADAGSDRTVDVGVTVALDGSASGDPDGDALTYRWSQVSGPTVTLSDTSVPDPAFEAPDLGDRDVATLTFELVVTDEDGATDSDTVAVTVDRQSSNGLPTAVAGDDRQVNATERVALDANGSSDPDGDDLTYRWEQVGGPPVSLSDATDAAPSFTAPDVTERRTLTFQLTVTDAAGANDSDTVEIGVVPLPSNSPPVADAGADQTVTAGTDVTLDGSGSTDPDGPEPSYRWAQVSGPDVSLSGVETAGPSFTAPNVSTATTVSFELRVVDGDGASDTDTVTVTVEPTTDASPGDDGAEDDSESGDEGDESGSDGAEDDDSADDGDDSDGEATDGGSESDGEATDPEGDAGQDSGENTGDAGDDTEESEEDTEESEEGTNDDDSSSDGSPTLALSVSCTVDGAEVTVANDADRTVEVRDIDSAGQDVVDGSFTLAVGDSRTLSGVDDGSVALRAFDPNSGDPLGERVSVAVDCDG